MKFFKEWTKWYLVTRILVTNICMHFVTLQFYYHSNSFTSCFMLDKWTWESWKSSNKEWWKAMVFPHHSKE